LILVLGVLVQVSFFSYLSFFGSTPDVIPVIVGALGLLGGGVVGAVGGFFAGLLLDSVLMQTLGTACLALLTAGYLAGRYREGFEISNSLVPALIIGGVTVIATALFSALQLMLGVSTPVSLLVLREIVVKGLLALLLALPVYPLIRRILRPALVDDAVPSRGRRRVGMRPAPRPVVARVQSRRRERVV
jgi:rod shape-determining protein MreD